MKGFTITELVVVISILTILLGLSVIAFNNYMVNYNVEKQIKTLYSDLMGARLHAMNENRQYVVSLSSKSYVIAVDNNYDETYDPGDIKIDKYSKGNLKYSFNWTAETNMFTFTIDGRGRISLLNGHISVDTPNSSESEYDCISISNTRIKMGKLVGSGTNRTCEVR